METTTKNIAVKRFTAPVVTLLVLALAACSGESANGADVAPVMDAASQTPSGAPLPDPPPESMADDPAPAPASVPAKPSTDGMQLARFDGYGDLRFGMTAAEAKQAWGGELNGKAGAPGGCYHLTPVSQPYFTFMIENDKFVRYDVGNDKEVAPGGGKRGMGADEIRALYTGRVDEQNHKYVQGGKYLRVTDSGGGNGMLVFETDAVGKVTEWRAGVAPQVDYVEGCS